MKTKAVIALVLSAVALAIFQGWRARQSAMLLVAANAEIALLTKRATDAERQSFDLTKSVELQRRLSPETAVVSSSAVPEPDTNAARLNGLRFLAQLNEQKLGNFTLAIVKPGEASISDSFVRLFGLTEADAARLNSALQETQGRIAQLVAANANSHVEGNAVVVTIDPFAADGDAIRLGLQQAFEATLGSERFAVMQALRKSMASDPFDQTFGGFGADAHTLTITRMATPTGVVFRLVDNRKSAEGKAAASIAQFPDPGNLPSGIRWMAPVASTIQDLLAPSPAR